MPLTPKGSKIKKAMEKGYGAKKGKEVFYASINKGKVKGAHKNKKHKALASSYRVTPEGVERTAPKAWTGEGVWRAGSVAKTQLEKLGKQAETMRAQAYQKAQSKSWKRIVSSKVGRDSLKKNG
jgi:hypothetical protein